MDEEIKELEKKYLSKIAKIFIMSQIHCEKKSEIFEEFQNLGITAKLSEVDMEDNLN